VPFWKRCYNDEAKKKKLTSALYYKNKAGPMDAVAQDNGRYEKRRTVQEDAAH